MLQKFMLLLGVVVVFTGLMTSCFTSADVKSSDDTMEQGVYDIPNDYDAGNGDFE